MKSAIARVVSKILVQVAKKTATNTYSVGYYFSPEVPQELNSK
jgi:cyclic lactone autoinducer peptide